MTDNNNNNNNNLTDLMDRLGLANAEAPPLASNPPLGSNAHHFLGWTEVSATVSIFTQELQQLQQSMNLLEAQTVPTQAVSEEGDTKYGAALVYQMQKLCMHFLKAQAAATRAALDGTKKFSNYASKRMADARRGTDSGDASHGDALVIEIHQHMARCFEARAEGELAADKFAEKWSNWADVPRRLEQGELTPPQAEAIVQVIEMQGLSVRCAQMAAHGRPVGAWPISGNQWQANAEQGPPVVSASGSDSSIASPLGSGQPPAGGASSPRFAGPGTPDGQPPAGGASSPAFAGPGTPDGQPPAASATFLGFAGPGTRDGQPPAQPKTGVGLSPLGGGGATFPSFAGLGQHPAQPAAVSPLGGGGATFPSFAGRGQPPAQPATVSPLGSGGAIFPGFAGLGQPPAQPATVSPLGSGGATFPGFAGLGTPDGQPPAQPSTGMSDGLALVVQVQELAAQKRERQRLFLEAEAATKKAAEDLQDKWMTWFDKQFKDTFDRRANFELTRQQAEAIMEQVHSQGHSMFVACTEASGLDPKQHPSPFLRIPNPFSSNFREIYSSGCNNPFAGFQP